METVQGTMTGTTGTTHGTRDTGTLSPSREVTLAIEINNDIVTGGIPEPRNTPLTHDDRYGQTQWSDRDYKGEGQDDWWGPDEDDVREHRFGYNDY